MELTNLINYLKAIQVTGEVQRKDISGINYDSRKVKNNSIFVAIKGFNTDGHKYILDAINKGAAAIVLEESNAIPDEIFTHKKIAKIVVRDSRKALAELSNYFYKEPSKRMKLIGVTGTNGKTTSTFFMKSILEESKNKVGLIGTIANYIGINKIETSLTTPESNDLNELLYNMIDEKCCAAVMEVSSHSLFLNRVYCLNFAAAIFTNLTIDHLDFHQSFENYFAAKKILFDMLNDDSFAIYNCDDKKGFDITKDSNAKKFSFGQNANANFRIENINVSFTGTKFNLIYNNKNYFVTTSLVGKFNAYNAAAAFSTAYLLGIPAENILDGIKNTKQVPGRFEVINCGNKKIVIDYSHTPDSLEKALLTIRELIENEKQVWTVFGCGGNRDKSKRPIMGKIATELSDEVIITNDNPRFENQDEIINEIISGISKKNYSVIKDRDEAIKTSIKKSEDDAIILIAGKGHENYQLIDGVKYNFSDKLIAEKYLFN